MDNFNGAVIHFDWEKHCGHSAERHDGEQMMTDLSLFFIFISPDRADGYAVKSVTEGSLVHSSLSVTLGSFRIIIVYTFVHSAHAFYLK